MTWMTSSAPTGFDALDGDVFGEPFGAVPAAQYAPGGDAHGWCGVCCISRRQTWLMTQSFIQMTRVSSVKTAVSRFLGLTSTPSS